MFDLVGRDFKSAVINMFKGLKDMMCEELKEIMRTMSHQNRGSIKRWKPHTQKHPTSRE